MDIHKYGEWIPWSGGECPVPDPTKVDVLFRSTLRQNRTSASTRKWSLSAGNNDITHYRLHVEDETPTIKPSQGKWGDITKVGKHDDYIEPLEVSSYIVTAEIKGLFSDGSLGTIKPLSGLDDWKLYTKHGCGWIGYPTDNAPVPKVDLSGDFKLEFNFEESVDNTEKKSNIAPTLTKERDNKMTNTTRTMKTVTLMDNDQGLEVELAMVYSTEVVVEGGDVQNAIQSLLMEDDIKEAIAKHNKMREATIDIDIRNRTGNTVKLLAVKLKDLDWDVK